MKKTILLISLIMFTTQVYGLAPRPISQMPLARYRAICTFLGCEYKGIWEGFEDIEDAICFNAPSKSTLLIPVSEFNVDSLRKKLKEHEVLFTKPEVDYDAGVEIMPSRKELEEAIVFESKDNILNTRAVLGAI